MHGEVAVITMNNPRVTGLGPPLRTGIVEGVDKALADPNARAIVLIGGGNAFSGGADIREFNTPAACAEPHLRQVIVKIKNVSKPVIAAVHKVAMGGGLGLALGCHYRVAAPGAQNTPLEVAYIRKLARETDFLPWEDDPPVFIKHLRENMEWYQQVGRRFYLAVGERVQKDCDLLVNGLLTTEEIADQVMEALHGKV